MSTRSEQRREAAQAEREIAQALLLRSQTIVTLTEGGFTHESAIKAAQTGDLDKLRVR